MIHCSYIAKLKGLAQLLIFFLYHLRFTHLTHNGGYSDKTLSMSDSFRILLHISQNNSKILQRLRSFRMTGETCCCHSEVAACFDYIRQLAALWQRFTDLGMMRAKPPFL